MRSPATISRNRLDLLDFDGDIDLDVEGTVVVSIDGGEDPSKLVGRRGEVLDALQELTRLAVHQKTAIAAGSCSTSPAGAAAAATS